MDNFSQDEVRYLQAQKKVRRIKGFYTHAFVYLVVNIIIAIINYQDLKPGETYFQYKNFITLFFWGIGLAAHGLSVFFPDYILGSNWEERKIMEIMAREKKENP